MAPRRVVNTRTTGLKLALLQLQVLVTMCPFGYRHSSGS